jgi:hypothetical protein
VASTSPDSDATPDQLARCRSSPISLPPPGLNREIHEALADPKINARFAELGGTVLPGSPADFGKLIADETEKWGKVIRAANIKAE